GVPRGRRVARALPRRKEAARLLALRDLDRRRGLDARDARRDRRPYLARVAAHRRRGAGAVHPCLTGHSAGFGWGRRGRERREAGGSWLAACSPSWGRRYERPTRLTACRLAASRRFSVKTSPGA